MGLMTGTGPFGPRTAGAFNFVRDPPQEHAIYLEPTARRVRGMLGGETVVDSRDVLLLHERGHLPVWYFPRVDVRFDLLSPTSHNSHCPFKGDASYWTVEAGGSIAESRVWAYPEPLAAVRQIADRVAFYWNAMDAWFEEDEEVFVHPRDPYHRVDAIRSSRHVRVSLDGAVLAESTRPLALFETALPSRWYLPKGDVVAALVPTTRSSRCPYKGVASYWAVGGHDDVAWSYESPIAEISSIEGLVCFFDERVDVDLDGERQERPRTQWS